MVIWSAKIFKSYLKKEPETYLTQVFFKDSCGFLLYFRLNERHHFPLLFHTQRRPSICLYAFITCVTGGVARFQHRSWGQAGVGVVVCDPTVHNCKNGNGPKKKRKRRTSWPRHGSRASVSSFLDHQVASVGFLLLRGWEGARKPFTEDTFGCLFVYICLYIHIHKTLYKKNPVVHHLWQKRKKKKLKNSFFH